MQKKPEVSIIIVHYHTERVLLECLKSIQDSQTKVTYEVIVVDNDERKKIGSSFKRNFPWVKYVKSRGNIGYGAGNNLGAKQARGDYLFILNPDTKVAPGAIDSLVNFLKERKDAATVAPTLIDKSGRIYEFQGTRELNPLRGVFALSFLNKLFPNNSISNLYWMKDVSKIERREVDVVPGSAFLVRREIFEELGGFDENFFLYFEESDFGKRVKEAGWKMFIIPSASVIHLWGATTPKTEKIKKIFAKSRFYYFKKHYGLVSAFTVEAFARFSKWYAAVLAILSLAAFLRLWKIVALMHFIGDFGWYYLSARDFLLSGKIPLVGISSSVPVLKQGAIFTWFLAGAFWLGKFNPISGAILTAILGILAVWGTYKVASNWFGKRVGIISATIAATSPFIVIHDRMPFVVAGIFPLTLLIAWLTSKILQGRKSLYFFLGLTLAILYQFELAGFILFPILLFTLLWQRVRVKWKDFLKFCLGGFIGLTPFIVHDLKQGVYLQTVGFGIWVVRKAARGIVAVISGGRNLNIFTPASAYLGDFVFPFSKNIAGLLFFTALALFILYLIKNKTQLPVRKFIFVWFFVGVAGFILQGIFSEAYMPAIFLPTILILSLFFDWLIAKVRYFGWTLLILVAGGNIIFMMKGALNPANVSPSFAQRLEAVDYIIKDAGGRGYELVYLGPGYMYESGDNHYRYLLWWKGNEPIRNASLKYTIVEPSYTSKYTFDRVESFGDIRVGVKER